MKTIQITQMQEEVLQEAVRLIHKHVDMCGTEEYLDTIIDSLNEAIEEPENQI